MELQRIRINELLVEHLAVDPEKVAPDANLMDDLGADSLDIVELVMAIEEEFAISIPDGEEENFKTVRDLYEAVESKTAAAA